LISNQNLPQNLRQNMGMVGKKSKEKERERERKKGDKNCTCHPTDYE
jgi:hypothetical protein